LLRAVSAGRAASAAGPAVAQRRWMSEVAEDGAGWLPETPIRHTTLEEVEEQGIEWTPTGTGGYPSDWAALNEVEYSEGDLRVGALGNKLGMTHTWDAWGKTIPLTVLELSSNVVVEQRTQAKHGVDAVVVGANNHTRPWKLLASTRGMFESKGVPYKKDLVQFKVADPSLLPIGQSVGADHFVPGQFVDVISTTIGKGFAGVMKRHNMAGGNASHGATKMHRKMGATGGGTDPGRVWKGKRMAGHMGSKRVITHSLEVYKIDTRWNVVYVKGAVSGAPGTVVTISDARRKQHSAVPPYPTALEGSVPAGIHVAVPTEEDPGEKMRG